MTELYKMDTIINYELEIEVHIRFQICRFKNELKL